MPEAEGIAKSAVTHDQYIPEFKDVTFDLANSPTISNPTDLVVQRLMDLFGVDTKERTMEAYEQIEGIHKWASNGGKIGYDDALVRMQEIMDRLGVPPMGQTKYSQLYQYTQIQKDIDRLSQEQKLLEKRDSIIIQGN